MMLSLLHELALRFGINLELFECLVRLCQFFLLAFYNNCFDEVSCLSVGLTISSLKLCLFGKVGGLLLLLYFIAYNYGFFLFSKPLKLPDSLNYLYSLIFYKYHRSGNAIGGRFKQDYVIFDKVSNFELADFRLIFELIFMLADYIFSLFSSKLRNETNRLRLHFHGLRDGN